MGDSSTSMVVPRPNISFPKKYAKKSRIVVFASYFRKLHVIVLPLLLVLTVPSLPSIYISVANRLLTLFDGCNLTLNHVFLVLNSVIAAIAVTTKLSRAESPVERIQNVAANNPDAEVQRKAQIERHELQQVTFRSTEQNSDISALDSKAQESFREDGMKEQEQQVIPESKRNPEDGFTRPASFRDADEPAASFRDAPNEEMFNGRMSSTEQPLPHQAAPCNSPEEIWSEITDKRHRHDHNPEDGFIRPASFRDASEPASFRDAGSEEVFNGRVSSPEQPLHHQASPGNSLEEVWREITDKRHRHSSGRQLRKSSSRVNNQAVCRAPTLSRVTLFPISSSRREFELPDVPELKFKSFKREPSAGVEELNRKAEEFITRFSQQMRLQRQESMIRYMRMNNTAICS